MRDYIELRAIEVGKYIIDSKATVRKTATKFGVSKSTVHKDITTRLKRQNAVLYAEVQAHHKMGQSLLSNRQSHSYETEVFASSSGKLKKMACLNCYKISLK